MMLSSFGADGWGVIFAPARGVRHCQLLETPPLVKSISPQRGVAFGKWNDRHRTTPAKPG
jgi:hypothetical protein